MQNVERLKARVELDKLEHSRATQKRFAEISLEMDRLRQTHELHIRKEYELYELVYPLVLRAYDAFSQASGIDYEPSPIDTMDSDGEFRSADEIQEGLFT